MSAATLNLFRVERGCAPPLAYATCPTRVDTTCLAMTAVKASTRRQWRGLVCVKKNGGFYFGCFDPTAVADRYSPVVGVRLPISGGSLLSTLLGCFFLPHCCIRKFIKLAANSSCHLTPTLSLCALGLATRRRLFLSFLRWEFFALCI